MTSNNGFNTGDEEHDGDIPDPRPQDIDAIKTDHEAGIVHAASPVQGEVLPSEDTVHEVAGLPIEAVPDNLMASASSTSGMIEILFRNRYTPEEIVQAGFNFNSVRTVVSKIKNKYPSQYNKEQKELTIAKASKTTLMTSKGKASELQQFMTNVVVPEGDLVTLKDGIQFGMSLMVVAVKMVQEMSLIGVQQTKPLIEIAKTMREGEKDAAKNSAMEAGMAAADAVHGALSPEISALRQKVDTLSNSAPGVNPMQDMMMKAMAGPMQQIMSSLFSSLPGMGGSQTQPPQTNQPPQNQNQQVGNWPVKEE